MRTVSDAHVAAMTSPIRSIDASVELVLGGIYPLDVPPAPTVSLPQARVSHPAHLVDGITSVPARYAVLGQWVVGSPEWGLAPGDGAQQMGVWGAATATPPVSVTVTWPAPREALAVTVASDPRWPGVPTAWTATLKLAGTTVATLTGGGTEHRQTVPVPNAPELIDELVVTITAWTPGERIRLVEASIASTVALSPDRLTGLTWLSELASEAGEISADEVAVSATGLDLPALQDRLVRQPGLLMGSIGPLGLDHVALPPMWTRSVRGRGSDLELTAQDAVSLMYNRLYRGFEPTANVTLLQLVQSILADIPSIWWYADPVLGQTTFSWAALPAQNVRPALADLASVTGLGVWTDGSGRLVIRQLSTPTTWLPIDEADVYAEELPVDDKRLVTRVEVTGGPLELVPPDELATWSGTLSGQRLVSLAWEEPATNRTPVLTGCTLVSVVEDSPCRWAGTVTGSGSASVAITGQVLRRASTFTRVEEDALASIRYGQRVHRIDHLLIQSEAQAQQLAQQILATRGSLRSRLVLEWRGDLRLEPGDGISWRGEQWVVERVETQLGRMLTQRLTCRRAAA